MEGLTETENVFPPQRKMLIFFQQQEIFFKCHKTSAIVCKLHLLVLGCLSVIKKELHTAISSISQGMTENG